jgi:hypothetical protein
MRNLKSAAAYIYRPFYWLINLYKLQALHQKKCLDLRGKSYEEVKNILIRGHNISVFGYNATSISMQPDIQGKIRVMRLGFLGLSDSIGDTKKYLRFLQGRVKFILSDGCVANILHENDILQVREYRNQKGEYGRSESFWSIVRTHH